MPVYEYRCKRGHVVTALRKVEDRERPEACHCGQQALKVILSAPRVFGDYEGYVSPASGQWIEGRRAREEDMKRTGCRPYDPSERNDLARREREQEKELDDAVDAAVDVSMAQLTQHDEGSEARHNLMRG